MLPLEWGAVKQLAVLPKSHVFIGSVKLLILLKNIISRYLQSENTIVLQCHGHKDLHMLFAVMTETFFKLNVKVQSYIRAYFYCGDGENIFLSFIILNSL